MGDCLNVVIQPEAEAGRALQAGGSSPHTELGAQSEGWGEGGMGMGSGEGLG